MDGQRIEIPGSAPKRDATERWSSAADPNQQVDATVVLRRRSEAAEIGQQLQSGHRPSREEAEQAVAADPADMAAVQSFLAQHGLTLTQENAAARTVHIRGTVQQMNDAFGIQLGWYEDAQGRRHLSYEGALTVPASLSGVMTAVLGLDLRPIATHHA